MKGIFAAILLLLNHVDVEEKATRTTAHELLSFPWKYHGKKVVVCGKYLPFRGSRYIEETSPYGERIGTEIHISVRSISNKKKVCVEGVYERKDGISFQEAKKRYGGVVVTHEYSDRNYWIK